MFAALLTTVLFSISAVTANRTTKFLSGSEANFWRLLCATFFLAVYAHTFGKGLSGNAFTTFFFSGCVGFGIGDLALFQAYPRLGSRLTILLVQCLAAPFAAFAEWIWLHTTLSWLQVLCGLTILAGVALALSPSRHLDLTRQQIWQGTLFGTLAAVGQGMGAALNAASAMNGYLLADRGTWISFKNKGELDILVEGDKRLFNQYGVMLVNPAKHAHVKQEFGQAFVDWLVSAEGQKAIADYKIDGQQLFFPNATDTGA
jgi:drug/metabolite transporter (DMT)-like permease